MGHPLAGLGTVMMDEFEVTLTRVEMLDLFWAVGIRIRSLSDGLKNRLFDTPLGRQQAENEIKRLGEMQQTMKFYLESNEEAA